MNDKTKIRFFALSLLIPNIFLLYAAIVNDSYLDHAAIIFILVSLLGTIFLWKNKLIDKLLFLIGLICIFIFAIGYFFIFHSEELL